jgi:hypothetical protein
MTATAIQTAPKILNATQLMLLKLFNRDMSEQETEDIRNLLLNYLNEKLQAQLEKDIIAKNISQADLDKVLNESNRNKL